MGVDLSREEAAVVVEDAAADAGEEGVAGAGVDSKGALGC